MVTFSSFAADAIVREIDRATNQVRVQAYSFTSVPVAKALGNAVARGGHVTAILDRSHRTDRYSAADILNNYGVKVHIDDKHAIAHNKVIIVDTHTVLTGSFNFTTQAEKSNAENLLVIHEPALAGRYLTNWTSHLQHSAVFQHREPPPR